MLFRKDIIPLDTHYPFNIFTTVGVTPDQAVLHFHDCLEIDFVRGGTGTNRIESREYAMKPGEFYVINNLEHHMAVSDGSLDMLVIVFDPVFVWRDNPADYEYLRPFFTQKVSFYNRVSLGGGPYRELRGIVGRIEKEWRDRQEGYQLVGKAMLMYLLALLYRHCKCRDGLDADALRFRKRYERIKPAVEYMAQNYGKPFSLETLARSAMMSRTYFSSCFKNVMGVSASKYVEKLRVAQACHLLKTAQKSVTEIAFETGFGSVPYFNHVFKNHVGVSPRKFEESECNV